MNDLPVSPILLKATNCFYILLDDRLTIQEVNDHCKSTFSVSAVEKGQSFISLFNASGQKKWADLFQPQHGQPNNFEIDIPIKQNKQIFNIRWSACAVKNENLVTGFEILGVPVTITQTKEATAHPFKDHFYYSLFEYNPEGVFISDADGNILKTNKAFESIADCQEGDLAEACFISLLHQDDASAVKDHFAKAAAGFDQSYTARLITKSGKTKILSIKNIPITEEGAVVAVNSIAKDITESLEIKKSLQKKEIRLKAVLNKLKRIWDSSIDLICAVDEKGIFKNVNPACYEILGYTAKELIGKNYIDFVYEEDLEITRKSGIAVKNGVEMTSFENRFYKKDRSVIYMQWSSKWDEEVKRYYSIGRDATDKKAKEAALLASEEKYRILFFNHPIPTWIYDTETLRFLEVNEAAINRYGYTRSEFMQLSLPDILDGSEIKRHENYKKLDVFDNQVRHGIWQHKKKNGEVFFTEITSNTIDFQGKKARLVLSIDRTEQLIAENELIKSKEKYLFLSEAAFGAIWDWDLATDEIIWNDSAKKLFEVTDLTEINKIGWWYECLHDDDKIRVRAKLDEYIRNKISDWEDEYRIKTGTNKYKYISDRGYLVFDDHHTPVRMIGAMQDLTERKAHENMLQKLNSSLEKRAKELAESNEELERFAYVASHDLQEPLRMVTSFLQLLEKRYKEKLDQKAHEYIAYAVDGAERMKRLILDLLEYSRVNSSKTETEDVDINEVVKEVVFLYKNILQQTSGTINRGNLPVVKGNKTQILQLFQNIIGNSFKYKSELPPVINISFEPEKTFYKFSISDNGIGIDPRFFHKIFIIFQRLHNREQYSGTGIGLAICKKIIDKHGGKIWVSSAAGQGSTFYFTLPKSN